MIILLSLALLASGLFMGRRQPQRVRFFGALTLLALVSVGTYASWGPFQAVAPLVAALWIGVVCLPNAGLPIRWGRHWRAAAASALGATTLLVVLAYFLSSAPMANDPGASVAASASLAATLAQADGANGALRALLHDYSTYHAVIAVEASGFILVLVGFMMFCWRRFKRLAAEQHWRFERIIYAMGGMVGLGGVLLLLLIVAANASTVVDPQPGFAQTLPELAHHQVAADNPGLYQDIQAWVAAGDPGMPARLRAAVQDRLAWQVPKAIVCSVLLLVAAVLTLIIWRQMLWQARTMADRWRWPHTLRLMLGLGAAPVLLLLLVMALGNTQAALAPVMLTLLMG